jgi:hypothetical protein
MRLLISARARDGGPSLPAVLALAVSILAMALPTRVEAAGAFVVDDSEIAKPGECKVESWASFASNTDFLGVTSPACVANLGRPVELGFSLARFRSDGEWGSELVLKGKTNILPAEIGKIGLGLSGGVAFDLLTGEHSATFINVPATFQIVEQFKINVNAGWLYIRSEDLNWFTYGAGFEWNFVKPLTLIGEVFGLAGHSVEPLTRTDPRAQLGLRFTPVESVDIDVIYGRNIFGENANWITLGLNVRFDAK